MDVPRARSKSRFARLWVWSLGLMVVGVAGATQLHSRLESVQRSELLIGKVTRTALVLKVRGAGILKPERLRWLTAESSGRVAAVLVEAGAEVQHQTVVVRLENLALRLQADTAEREVHSVDAQALALQRQNKEQALSLAAEQLGLGAALSDARRVQRADVAMPGQMVSRNTAQKTAERVAELSQRQVLLEQKVELLTSLAPRQLQAVRDQAKQLRRVLKVRRQMLERLDIRAGSEGTLQHLLVEPGQWVVPGTEVAKVMVSRQLKAVLFIPADRAGRVQVGQVAKVRTGFGGASTSTLAGIVRRIAPAAREGTVDVEVTLLGELPENARPDQTVDGEIETERVDNALQVARPVGLPLNGKLRLFRLDRKGNRARRVHVVTGRVSLNVVEVVSGLETGDEVVLSDMSKYRDQTALLVE